MPELAATLDTTSMIFDDYTTVPISRESETAHMLAPKALTQNQGSSACGIGFQLLVMRS